MSPVKAHLYDGSVIVFRNGVRTQKGILKGEGIRYDVLRTNSWPVHGIDRDSVAFVESYKHEILPLPTILCLIGVAGSFVLLIALAMGSYTTIE